MQPGTPSERFPYWILLGSLLIPCAYLPSLGTRFDFIDDGNLVYPLGARSWGEHWQALCHRVQANVEHLGPFRPVLHAYWQLEAELLQGDPFLWRLTRLVWSMLATAMLLWFLHELRLRAGAALLAAALAMWNPLRNEIWTSLTLSEGVAMPFAFLALVSAARAPRSARPLLWDLSAMLAILLALGCKNTFAAVVPGMILLRTLPDGTGWREGLRRHAASAALLLLPLMLPAGHYLYFKTHWHPGQYSQSLPTWTFAGQLLRAVAGAASADFMALGLALSVLALRFRAKGVAGVGSHRRAILAGLLLLVGGYAIYLPIGAISGRYTIPAVWGVDILLAVLFHELASVRLPACRRGALAAVGGGLLLVLVACVGKQLRFAARAELLWAALQTVEQEVPRGSCVGWVCGPGLNVEEGIHFAWHLHARGRADLSVRLLSKDGSGRVRVELPATAREAEFLIHAGSSAPAAGWEQVRTWLTTFHQGRRRYECSLWKRPSPDNATP